MPFITLVAGRRALGKGESGLAGGKMRGRADVSFVLEEVWWLRVVEMRGTSLWRDRFDREIDPFFGEHEGRRSQGIISSCTVMVWNLLKEVKLGYQL